jgi:phospholipid/cholesterol/gamma-HCH transport system substrate-binding protein
VSDYETIQKRRNVIVGIFVMLAFFALTAMIYKFGDLPTVVSRLGSFPVYVQFPTAPGVQRDTPVRFCGYQIGKVTEVMAPDVRRDLKTNKKYHQTVVVLSIDGRYTDIPSNVQVKLMTRGLGSSYIELKLDPEKLPAPQLDPNKPMSVFLMKDTWLQGSTGMTSEFFPEESQKKLEQLVEGIKALVDNANKLLGDPQNRENLKRTIANLPKLTDEAVKAVRQATEAMEQFRQFASVGTTFVQDTGPKLDELVVTIVETSGQLGKTAAELRLVLEKVNQGQGSAARLVNDAQLYENLLESTQQMQLLLRNLKSFITEARDKGVPLKLK